jgi:hypothetical protein
MAEDLTDKHSSQGGASSNSAEATRADNESRTKVNPPLKKRKFAFSTHAVLSILGFIALTRSLPGSLRRNSAAM